MWETEPDDRICPRCRSNKPVDQQWCKYCTRPTVADLEADNDDLRALVKELVEALGDESAYTADYTQLIARARKAVEQ